MGSYDIDTYIYIYIVLLLQYQKCVHQIQQLLLVTAEVLKIFDEILFPLCTPLHCNTTRIYLLRPLSFPTIVISLCLAEVYEWVFRFNRIWNDRPPHIILDDEDGGDDVDDDDFCYIYMCIYKIKRISILTTLQKQNSTCSFVTIHFLWFLSSHDDVL